MPIRLTTMAGSKKERQKQNRRRAREQQASQTRRQQRLRRFRLVAIIVVVGMIAPIGLVTLFNALSGNDDSSGHDATTTTPTTTPGGDAEPFADAPPEDILDDGVSYTASMETSEGRMVFSLDPATARVDVNNFVWLAEQGFYDGLTFHRIVPEFVVQGGDPNGDGTGGPGYNYDGSTPQPGPDGQTYTIGSLAMANSGDPSSNGSQFFVVTGPQGEQLPANYSLFGQLVEGDDVLQAIASVPVQGETPVEAITITGVDIITSPA